MLKAMVWCLAATAVILLAATAARTAPADEAASAPAPTSQPAASQPSPPPPPPPEHPDRPDRHDRRDRQENEAEVLAVLKERLPLRYERLMELKESDPSNYARNLGRMRWWYSDWKRLPGAIQDADIVQQTLTVQMWQIVDVLRQAPEAERPALQTELAVVVAKQFEAETVVMAYRLEMMEQALARMREHLAERREKVDTFLADRMERLMRATTQPADQDESRRRRDERPPFDAGPPPPRP